MQRYLVIYTQSARDDVNAIAEHIRLAADDAIAARFTGRIIAAVEKAEGLQHLLNLVKLSQGT